MTPAAWRELWAAASLPPTAPRRPLLIVGAAVGSIESVLAVQMLAAALPLRNQVDGSVEVIAPADDALAQIARWLRDNDHAGRWRDEALPVCDEAGRCVARVERAVVRPLGIATHAVHLVGWADEDSQHQWLQQRAFDKATDPGLWDTMVGGLIGVDESVEEALARECGEEAGLRVTDLHALQPAGLVTVRRPVNGSGSGTGGYMVEHIHALHCVVPACLAPVNRDGEVARFECIDATEADSRIATRRMTLEAALVIARCRERP
ncbi:MAG: NUDIX domain-containing protein [Burkholderiaceae bacterium]